MTTKQRALMLILVISGMCLVQMGCSDNPVGRLPITVKVTVAGQPLERGTVRFDPLPGSPSYQAGGTVENGELYISTEQGLPPGEYRVTVSVPSALPDRSIKAPIADSLDRVPPEFNVHSQLVLKVAADGKNECVVDIPQLIN